MKPPTPLDRELAELRANIARETWRLVLQIALALALACIAALLWRAA